MERGYWLRPDRDPLPHARLSVIGLTHMVADVGETVFFWHFGPAGVRCGTQVMAVAWHTSLLACSPYMMNRSSSRLATMW